MNTPSIPSPDKLENFERAFTTCVSGCRQRCHCGREFFDNANSGYDWAEGELEKLLDDPKATALDYAVETIIVEGREYVSDCDCWHARAAVLIGFIDSHARGIAAYLNREKRRLEALAEHAPTVEEATSASHPPRKP